MDPKELRAKRAGLIGQARELNDRAGQEDRELTADEERQFDQILEDADKLKVQYERIERLAEQERQLATSQGAVAGQADRDGDPENRGQDPGQSGRSQAGDPLPQAGCGCASLLPVAELGPGVAEGHGPVEHERFRLRVGGVDAEVAEALELVPASGLRARQARFELASRLDLQGVGIQSAPVVLGFVRLLRGEQVIVEPDLGIDAVGRGDPVDCTSHLSTVGGLPAPGLGIVGAVQLGHLAGLVLDHVDASDEVAVAQTDLPSGGETAELPRRVLLKVVPLDIQLSRKGHLARPHRGVLGVVDGGQLVDLALRIVVDDDLQGVEDGHRARSAPVQVLPNGVLKHGDVDGLVSLGDADGHAERSQGLRSVAAPAQSRHRGHARIVPARYKPVVDHLDELSLAQHGMGDV